MPLWKQGDASLHTPRALDARAKLRRHALVVEAHLAMQLRHPHVLLTLGVTSDGSMPCSEVQGSRCTCPYPRTTNLRLTSRSG